ncbi:MAG: hypothetical protein HC908_13445 [Calothrix sp. SM1_7_51]|nr:hypothetical protein [Calothrix sp. SM1_7_51]
MAIIFSDYYGTEDLIESEFPILWGSVHCLKRGEDASERLMVKTLAKMLLMIYKGV